MSHDQIESCGLATKKTCKSYMKNTEKTNLEQENEVLKAQLQALSTLNPALYSDIDNAGDEIDLRELWNVVWAGKWLISIVTLFFALASTILAINLPDEYKSTAVLAPASTSSASQLGKLAGQFGGLASLAGINLGDVGVEDKTLIAIELTKSWGFLEKFIYDNKIEVEVFAVNRWNRKNNELEVNRNVYDPENEKWIRDFDPDEGESAAPTSWELFEEFEDRVEITQDSSSGLVRLSIEYYSPEIAKQWVDKLVIAINSDIKLKDKLDATNSIEYLKRQINETKVTGMQTVFYQLIEEQTKTLMLTEISDEYVLKTIIEAKIPEEPSKPKKFFIIILGMTLGLIVSCAYLLCRYYRNQS